MHFMRCVICPQAMFKVYKARDRTKFFTIEHWAALLEAARMLGPHTGEPQASPP